MNSVEEVRHLLKVTYESLDMPISLVITGSFSRKDVRENNNKIMSDIDILCFIIDPEIILEVKKIFKSKRILSSLKITYIFTKIDVINEYSVWRGYLKDINSSDILMDNIRIWEKLCEYKNKPCPENAKYLSAMQMICYYFSKYLVTEEDFLKHKVMKLWGRLTGKELLPSVEEIIKSISEYEKLESINSFYSQIKNDDFDKYYLLKKVRNNVFLENQGLPFEVSVYEV